jgi:ketosteroid isomerase-like protein
VHRVELTLTEGHPAALQLYRSLGVQAWGTAPAAIPTAAGFRGKVHMTRLLAPRGPARSDPVTATRMPNAVPDEPTDLIGQWIEAFNAHDLDRITALYADDALLWGTFAAEPLDTADARRAYFAQAFSPALQAQAAAGHLHTQGEGGAVVVSGRYRLAVVRDGGPQTLAARFTAVLRATPAGWRIVHHHSSLVPAPPAAPAHEAPAEPLADG